MRLGIMRLGIFGGSFDPVHNGHLLLARCCQEQAALEEVWFTPAFKQPLKPEGPSATEEHRCALLKLAIADRSDWKICRQEIDRGGLSYTVDTLQAIQAERPDARLYFLMGADALHDLPHWWKPQEICQLATPLVVHRAGEREPDFGVLAKIVDRARQDEIEQHQVEMPAMPVRSREIRELLAKGASIEGLVPPAVAEFLLAHGLYRG